VCFLRRKFISPSKHNVSAWLEAAAPKLRHVEKFVLILHHSITLNPSILVSWTLVILKLKWLQIQVMIFHRSKPYISNMLVLKIRMISWNFLMLVLFYKICILLLLVIMKRMKKQKSLNLCPCLSWLEPVSIQNMFHFLRFIMLSF